MPSVKGINIILLIIVANKKFIKKDEHGVMENKQVLSKHINVMLLAMSTLPFNPKMNTYQVKENGQKFYFKSLSQMEPHTKYVLHMLAKKGERLDKIVILESGKARTEKPENWKQETATTLFEKRILSYLGVKSKVEIKVDDELYDLKETSCDFYTDGNAFPGFCLINLDDPVFFWNAVEAIRSKKDGKTVHLYMDMQGGDRNAVSQMNAIAELLVRQNVIIKGRFANDFEPKRTPPLHTIREASKEYRTYELISAMDIFSRYGWGDKLEEYFRGTRRNSSKENRLITAIKDASIAISRCNGDKFGSAVRRIENLQKEFEKPDRITEMDVVYQDIYENYKPLFGADFPYVEQIRWCLDRHFLQQALTIFEAKMPTEFIRSGLIYYLKKGERRDLFFQKCENLYFNLPEHERYRMKDLNHYLIKDYCNDYKKHIFKDPENLLRFGLGIGRKTEVVSLIDKYRSLSTYRNEINHASAGSHSPKGFFSYMKTKYLEDSNWNKKSNTKYEKKIRDFLDEWENYARQIPQELRKNIADLN